MSLSLFKFLLVFLGVGFTIALGALCLPPLMEDPRLLNAIAGGFVNPYAAGYSLDAIVCWFVLAVWVVYEAQHHRVRHGWVALVLGVMPGVAVGFAVYLILRLKNPVATAPPKEEDSPAGDR
jgi:hypothetical protein